MHKSEQRLVLISNRLPVTIKKSGGEIKLTPSTGGLATGIKSFFNAHNSLWIGWPGMATSSPKEMQQITSCLRKEGMFPVFLSRDELKRYYEGFCNATIWPLFHYFTQNTYYSDEHWQIYQKVNQKFADVLLEKINENDIIWVHDYQLLLLPRLIREKLPNVSIGFFLHIPFPSYEIFRYLPWRSEILTGILGADLVGFHTYDYARHFLSAVRRLLGIDHVFNQLIVDSRMVRVDSFPMGIDYDRYAEAGEKEVVRNKVRKFRDRLGSPKLIISIDRLDYSKGILQRLKAFNIFLRENKEYHGKVTMVMVVVPSRPKVPAYRTFKEEIDRYVGRLNGRYGTLSWTPIHYFYRSLDFNNLAAFYNLADIALITPFRDGMNLIAKEYVASKRDRKGVLILSEMAGAASELSEAIIINPNNVGEISAAIKTALNMKEDEQIRRNTELQDRLRRYDVFKWVHDFVSRLREVKSYQSDLTVKELKSQVRTELLEGYHRSQSRLIFLDYDGTLVHFSKDPQEVAPDAQLLKTLRKLSHQAKTEVVLISGRDRQTLDSWLAGLNIGIVAEHGAWLKEKGKDWQTLIPLDDNWKKEIFPVLQHYVDRTPKSFIEEKDYSLVWHYRNVDSALAAIRTQEMIQNMTYLVSNLNLQVMEGNKIIEIKNSGVDKGKAVLTWLDRHRSEFILAIGDDTTDEDIFRILPERANSIKVGIDQTGARFRVKSPKDVRKLINALIRE